MALPDYLKDTAQDFAKQLTATTSVPIETGTFTGRQFVGGEDPLQTQAASLAASGVGSYEPFLTAAQTSLTGAQDLLGPGAGTGTGSISSFMSTASSSRCNSTLVISTPS